MTEHWTHVVEPEQPIPSYFCPCCKFKTLHGRSYYEICEICFWEDDGQDEHDAEVIRGGPNHDLSLRQAQTNFAAIGAVQDRFRKFVRAPREDEERELK